MQQQQTMYGYRPCYITKGLLGAFVPQKEGDLITLDGTVIRIPQDAYTQSTTQMVYEQFGLKCKLKMKVFSR